MKVDLKVVVVNSCCFMPFVSTICVLFYMKKRFIFNAVTRKFLEFHATFYIYSSDLYVMIKASRVWKCLVTVT